MKAGIVIDNGVVIHLLSFEVKDFDALGDVLYKLVKEVGLEDIEKLRAKMLLNDFKESEPVEFESGNYAQVNLDEKSYSIYKDKQLLYTRFFYDCYKGGMK